MSQKELKKLEKALQKLLYSQNRNSSQEEQNKKLEKFEKVVRECYLDYEIEQEANNIELKNYYITKIHKNNYYADDDFYNSYNNYY